MKPTDDFFNLSPAGILAFCSSLSLFLSNELTAEKQNILGNFLTALGSNLILTAGQLPSPENAGGKK